jgi:N-acetylmuramoyl-L-alanine amidase
MRRTRPRTLGALFVLTLLAAAGCARRPLPVPSPPPPVARAAPGYEARLDSLLAVDPSALLGRRVALDPGHGGFFRGSVGVGGLTEAAVNLDVAARLRELLAARGAAVFLTRDADRDFLTPADSALRADLAERTRLANAFAPDLFVSIHHNADAGGRHDRNEIQTYYKLGDEGPSLDAATSIHRYLKRNLAIERHRILPGNYFVLRSSVAPAVLTEASFLTNPDVEARLALPKKRRLEAEALYLGIAHYFARGAPSIEELVALEDSAGHPAGRPDSVFSGSGPMLRGRVAGAYDQAELLLDGVAVPLERREAVLVWQPRSPLAPGVHVATLRAALAGAGSARERSMTFRIRRPARALRVEPMPAVAPRAGGWIAVRIEAVDAFGFPVLDTLGARVRAACRCDTQPAPRVRLAAGSGWAYVKTAARRSRPARQADAVRLELALSPGRGAAAVPTRSVRIEIERAGSARWRTAFLRRMPGDSALHDAPGTGRQRLVRWVNEDGFAAFPLDSLGRARVPALPGYRPLASATAAGDTTGASAAAIGPPLQWVAIAGGALHGRRILLDPEGGGNDTAGMGPSGTRAAVYNMDVARALSSYLTAAGAEVGFGRSGDYGASDEERVRASEAFRADRYLRIGHRAAPPRLGYYFSSAVGRGWAEHTAAALAQLGLPGLPLVEDAQYPLQQTSCPALYVSAARIDDPHAEEWMVAPGALRAEAYALFLGLVREWSPQAELAPDSLEVRDAGGPAAGAFVTLGDAFVLQADRMGRVRFARTEPGPLAVRVEHPRLRSMVVLLDSHRGVVVTGPPGGSPEPR